MGNRKRVKYLPLALESIFNISIHIENEGYPLTAMNFKRELFDFGNSLGQFPERYQICRNPAFRKRNFQCAVFKKNYIFIYKPAGTEVVIYNVVHTSRYIV